LTDAATTMEASSIFAVERARTRPWPAITREIARSVPCGILLTGAAPAARLDERGAGLPAIIVTGATQGFGLAIARALSALPRHRVVLAVRDTQRGEAVASGLGANAEVRRLDCASFADVRRFVAEWDGPLAGLVNNAGLQQVAGTRRSAEGWEETLAVNHLAATGLAVGLLPRLEGGRVVFIGSGTHNPDNRTATVFGFRGARFTSIDALARGECDATSDR
jgi:NADP-dependent 3-hydroxy acid dehydrogenase YdfG